MRRDNSDLKGYTEIMQYSNLNPKFYSIGNGSSYGTGFHDVTTGNNTLHGTTGFTAGTGYDQVTGWGSFKASGLSGLIG